MKEQSLNNLIQAIIHLMMSIQSDYITVLLPLLAVGLDILKEIINFNLQPLSQITEAIQSSSILKSKHKKLP